MARSSIQRSLAGKTPSTLRRQMMIRSTVLSLVPSSHVKCNCVARRGRYSGLGCIDPGVSTRLLTAHRRDRPEDDTERFTIASNWASKCRFHVRPPVWNLSHAKERKLSPDYLLRSCQTLSREVSLLAVELWPRDRHR